MEKSKQIHFPDTCEQFLIQVLHMRNQQHKHENSIKLYDYTVFNMCDVYNIATYLSVYL